MKIESNIGLGNLSLITGDTQKSNFYYNKGLRIAARNKLFFKKATILNGLSNVKITETKTKEAERYAKSALSLFKSMSGKKQEIKKGVAESLNNLGGVYSSEGKLKKALDFYKKSLIVRRSFRNKEGMAINLNNIGLTYLNLRNYKKALVYLERSLNMRKEIGYIQGIALCLNNIGIVNWRQKRYKEGTNFFKESLKIQRRLGDKSGIATSLNNLGVVYRVYGRYKDAIRCHKESLYIRKEIGDRFGMTINLNQMGWIYLKRGELRHSLLTNEAEGKICREIDNEPRLMNYYGLRGNILKEMHQFRKAYTIIEKSLRINRKLGLIVDEARDLCELSQVIVLAHKEKKVFLYTIKKAEELLKKSLILINKERKRFEHSVFLAGFAKLSILRKNYDRALEYIKKSEKVAVSMDYKEFLPEIFYLKANILFSLNKPKSKQYIERAERLAKKIGLKSILTDIRRLKKRMK